MAEKKTKRGDVIERIVSWREDHKRITGKTVIQKLLYFIQIRGVDLNYSFKLYTYGPYSREVMEDIDLYDYLGIIHSSYNDEYDGYEIKKGPSIGYHRGSISSEEEEVVSNVLENFGEMKARELELRTTILLLNREFDVPRDEMIREVQEIKPKYTPDGIEDAIGELEELHYL